MDRDLTSVKCELNFFRIKKTNLSSKVQFDCWLDVLWQVQVHFVSTFELGNNVVKRTEYFVSLQTGVVITEQFNVTVNGKELTDTTEYLTL